MMRFAKGKNQGSLSNGIDNTIRMKEFKRLHPLFTYVLFSVAHFLSSEFLFLVVFFTAMLVGGPTIHYVGFKTLVQNLL